LIEIAHFKNKLRTHGPLLTLCYSAEFLVRPASRRLWTKPVLNSHSQRFEDRIVDNLLGNKATGTYLDIGAYDPDRLSNTKRFYDRGWRGCNVEPNPKRFEKFVRERHGDINLNVGLSDSAGELTFFEVVPDAFSTFSGRRAEELKEQGARIVAEIEVPVITMANLFEEYLDGAQVDFCTIDTEGMDTVILKSNDWSRFRPRVICAEVSISGDEANITDSIEGFLMTVGYRKHTQTRDFGVPLNENLCVGRVRRPRTHGK
jgi:FkbM family methyltransferase